MRLRVTPFVILSTVGLLAAAVLPESAAAASGASLTSGAVYTLTNVNSTRLMDVQYGSTSPGAPVLQWHLNGGANQQWTITQTTSGSYTLKSANDGLCLDTPSPANTNPPVQLVQNTCDGSTHQQWNIQPVGDGSFTIANVANGLLVDDADNATADGTAVIQWAADGGANQHWKLAQLTRVGAFSAGLMSWGQKDGMAFNNQTIRMVAHVSVSGGLPRLRLSNAYGAYPVTIGAVDLARQTTAGSGTAIAGSHHTVTFNGASTVTIPAWQEVYSDPISMGVGSDEDLLVSIYLPNSPANADTWHWSSNDTTWVSSDGNHAAEDGVTNYPTKTDHWFVLAGVDVTSSTATGTIVAIGDSITEGAGSTVNTNHRWPDDLARALNGASGGPARGVVDVGIGSNRILTNTDPDGLNIALKTRFPVDAVRQTGAKEVIMLEGINDIGNNIGSNGATPLTAPDLESGMQNVISQAHSAGLKIIGCTILPFQGAGYYTVHGEQVREAVNTWIRTGGAFDSVVDLDKAMQDPANALALNPAYDGGDHLHPNDAGYQHMADTVYATATFS